MAEGLAGLAWPGLAWPGLAWQAAAEAHRALRGLLDPLDITDGHVG